MSLPKGGVSQTVLQQIRDATDITDLISRYVTLSKMGQNLRGLCPFHSEKTPSFTVTPAKQMFYCFGCGVGGDALTFLMKKEGMEFPEAVSELAKQAGVSLPIQSAKLGHDGDGTYRRRLEDLHTVASAWFRNNLLFSSQGEPARAYLATRGIGPAIHEEFGLGYALPEWDGLIRHLLKSGASPNDLVKAGLAVNRDDRDKNTRHGNRCYDRFRNRLIFPICDVRGNVIAFGGRTIHDETPKYLNSPETPLFNKGKSLFGLDRARDAVRREQALLLVEGYFDVMVLHQAGIRHVAAPLGTALTKDHMQIIRRLSSTVIFVFDGDAAGMKAALRALDIFVNSGMTVKVAVLPSGEDPDSFVRSHGNEALLHIVANARSLLEFTIAQCLHRMSGETTEDRVRSVDEVLRILQKTDNHIEREEYTRQVAERLGVRQQLLVDRYRILKDSASKSRITSKPTPPSKPSLELKASREERDLMVLLVKGELERAHILALREEYFTIPLFRRIVEKVLSHVTEKDDGHTHLDEIFHSLAEDDEECRTRIAQLTVSSEHFDDIPAYIRGCLDALERKHLRTQLDQLIVQLRSAEQEQRQDDIERINQEINQLRGKKAGH